MHRFAVRRPPSAVRRAPSRCAAVLAMALTGSLIAPARAQDAPAAPAPAASQPVATLPAVVVTGSGERKSDDIVERRSRGGALFGTSDLREVPFTVNVITSAEIANKQAKTIGAALAGDPAVRNDYGATGAYPTESFNIRGFSINTSAILKDGMPMANQVTQALENIDQVEVIRGPMGFRYGFLSPGGAINLVSKRPTRDLLRSFTFSTDEHGSAQGHLDLGGPLDADGRLGYRVNAVLGEQKNFVRPVDIERQLISGNFDFHVTRDTTLNLAVDHYRWRQGPESFHFTVPDVNGNEIRGIPPDQYFGQKSLPDNDFRTSTLSLGAESRLSDALVLSTQFAVYDWNAYYSQTSAMDAQPNGDFHVSVFKGGYKSRNLTNTTFLNFKTKEPGLQHSLTGGFTVARSKGSREQNQVSGVLGTVDGAGVLTPFVNNFFNPIQFPDTTPASSGPYVPYSDSRERGLFVSDEMRIGEAWRLLLALRRSTIDDRGLFSPGGGSSTDPTFGLMFDVSPEVSVYASHATGLEKGGIAPAEADNRFTQLPAQKTKQIEIGAKSDLAEGLTLDTAVFRIEKAAEFTNADNVYVQSGRQVHTGGEVRLIGRVLPALTVTTGVQLLRARLTGDPATAGQRPQNVPKLNFSFSGDWSLAAVPGLTLTGAVFRATEREISVPAIPAKAGAYTRFDLGARYRTQLGANTLIGRLNVENVTDRTYYNVGWYQLYEFGAPRTVSASVELKF